MSIISSDLSTGIISITQSYNLSATQSDPDATPYFTTIGDEYTISFVNLQRVEKMTDFSYTATGILGTRYLETTYRVSRNSNTWTDWLELDEEINNFPPFDPLDTMYLDIRFTRKGTKTDGSIRLNSFYLKGFLLKDSTDGTVIVDAGKSGIISPPYVFKVFKITDLEIISLGDILNVEIKYRFSQDNTRTWTQWEILTKENITTVRINPVRFFHIEYLITNNSSSSVKIQDINLIGDYQNVTLDYQKTNLYGIRECCQSYLLGGDPLLANTTGVLGSEACANSSGLPVMTDEDKAKLYNPYQQSQAMDLLNKMSTDAVEVFGHKVKYFATDPDGNGIDYSLHEYQLYNIICEGDIKVAVENNQFPDNQITMNTFDLGLFDSFEVHITKQAFKQVFGAQRRPSKEDIVWFCDINRIFIVDHSQQFRSFNNAAIYYKVILKKYNKSANILPGSKTVEDRIKELTKNTTIDELFGIENVQDKEAVANKPQLQTLTREPIRLEYSSEIVKELIENSTTIISKQHYDFSSLLTNGFNTLTYSVPAVKYKNVDSIIKKSDNIGYYMWFNINNYIDSETYNLFTHFDESGSLGWKSDLIGDNIVTKINSDSYTFSFTGSTQSASDLVENVWYCYVLNIDQRDRKMSQWIYKRNVDIDSEEDAKYLSSTELEKVYYDQQDLNIFEFELENIEAMIMSSDMKVTNIRMFIDIIPESEHNKILNQYVIADDSKYLVFADNANDKIILGYYPYN